MEKARKGMQTVGYIRCSTIGQATEGVTLEAQRRKIQQYCELHDMNLTEIVEDAGLSGRSISGRPGIKRILEMVKRGLVDNLIIYRLDRMARNLREACEIADLLQKKGVGLHCITERIDTTTATGRLFYQILGAMGEWERSIIAERTVAALAVKRQNGERISRHAPYGHEFKDGMVVENASEQAVLRKVHQLRRKGYSYQGVADYLRNKTAVRNRQGNPFTKAAIWQMTKAA